MLGALVFVVLAWLTVVALAFFIYYTGVFGVLVLLVALVVFVGSGRCA